MPKCAGTSFSNVLESWYGNKLLLHYHNEKRNKPPKKYKLTCGLFKKRPRKGLCIHGHFNNARGNGLSDYYPNSPQMISVLRDPFDLHVSNYFYVKRQELNNKGGAMRGGEKHKIISNDWSLKEFLEEEPKSYILDFMPQELTIDNFEKILEKQFLYIGISEQLQKSVDLLANILNFKSLEVSVSNKSQKDEEISVEMREAFERSNPLEYAIYNYARSNWGNSD